MSPERLAEMLGKHVDEVYTLESIVADLPGGLTREAVWALAVEERRLVIERLQLPECPVGVALLEKVEATEKLKEVEAGMAALNAHVQSCEVCGARTRALAHLGEMPPPPLPPTAQMWATIARAPKWLRPPLYGGVAMLFLALFRTFGIFMQVRPFSTALLLAGRLLGISFIGGFGAGVAYMLVRQATRRLGAVSPYISGISAVAAGFAIVMVIHAQLKGTLHLPSQVEVVPYAITALVIGLFVGHQVRHLD